MLAMIHKLCLILSLVSVQIWFAEKSSSLPVGSKPGVVHDVNITAVNVTVVNVTAVNVTAVNVTAVLIARKQMRDAWIKTLPLVAHNNKTLDDGSDDEDNNDADPDVLDESVRLFEGDIRGIQPDINLIPDLTFNTATNKVMWPDKKIPYELNTYFKEAYAQKIRAAMKVIMDNTCIKFIERSNENSYVKFVSGAGSCNSYVGYQGENDKHVVQYDMARCNTQRIILHELLHVLGMYHEMSRSDRDKYITIQWDNVLEHEKKNFNNTMDSDSHGLPFDYDSVTMYTPNMFAKDESKPTITVKGDPARKIASSDTLTNLDIFTINDFYECKIDGCSGEGRFGFNNKCYYISSIINVPFEGAENACQGQNGKLAALPPELIPKFITSLNNENLVQNIYWLANQWISSSANDSNENNDSSNGSGSSAPNADSSQKSCTSLLSGELRSSDCSDNNSVICEINV